MHAVCSRRENEEAAARAPPRRQARGARAKPSRRRGRPSGRSGQSLAARDRSLALWRRDGLYGVGIQRPSLLETVSKYGSRAPHRL
jgi:hypothetical protein